MCSEEFRRRACCWVCVPISSAWTTPDTAGPGRPGSGRSLAPDLGSAERRRRSRRAWRGHSIAPEGGVLQAAQPCRQRRRAQRCGPAGQRAGDRPCRR
jgi:hypothetical protein